MHSGHFFHLDYHSDEGKKQHVFRYTKIIRRNDIALEGTKHAAIPKYPIYVTFNSNNIIFHFIGVRQEIKDEATKNIWEKYDSGHYEAFILPLSSNLPIQNDLEKALKVGIKEEIKLNKTIYQRNEGVIVADALDLEQNTTSTPVAYSNLESVVHFSVDALKENNKNPFFNIKTNNQKLGVNSFELKKRELILDFLFDFRHSMVFQNSPYFEQVDQKLKENLLLDALWAKCEYYYTREQYWRLYTSENKEEERLKELSKELQDAEEDYFEIIFREDAPSVFDASEGWLFNVEKELRAVVFNDNLRFGLDKNVFRAYLAKCSLFQILGISLLNAILISFILFFVFYIAQTPTTFSSVYSAFIFAANKYHGLAIATSLFVVLSMALIYLNPTFQKLQKSSNSLLPKAYFIPEKEIEKKKLKKLPSSKSSLLYKKINNFFLKRFDVFNAFRAALPFSLQSVAFLVSMAATLFLAISISGLIWYDLFEKKEALVNVLESICYLLAVLGSFIGIGLGLLFGAFRFYFRSRIRGVFIILALLPSIVLAFCTSNYDHEYIFSKLFLLSFLFLGGVFALASLNKNNKSRVNSLLILHLFFVLGIFILSQIEPKILEPNSPAYLFSWSYLLLLYFPFMLLMAWLMNKSMFSAETTHFTFNLAFPRMQMGVVSSWLLLASTEELWKANLDISNVLLGVMFLVFLIATYYIFNVIKNQSSDLVWWEVVLRAGFILFIGFSMSVAVGIIAMSVVGKNMLLNSGFLEDKYGEQLIVYEVKTTKDELHYYTIEQLKIALTENISYLENIAAQHPNFDAIAAERQLQLDHPKYKLDGLMAYFFKDISCDEDIIKQEEEGIILMNRFDTIKARYQTIIEQDTVDKAVFKLDILEQHRRYVKLLEDTKAWLLTFKDIFYFQKLEADNLYRQRNFLELFQLAPVLSPCQHKIEQYKRSIGMYPRLLLLNATLALFVGIFIQIATQNKSITEPL